MNKFEIEAESRHDRGKGASRRLRRAGKVPAIVYGAHKDPVAIQLGHNDVLQHAEHEAFYSHILDLKIDGTAEKVVIKDMQRHPFKPFIQHMDFQRVDESEALTMRVPLHFLNEGTCVGVKQHGGVISHLMSDLEITCLPKDLPEYIEVDVAELDVGDAIHLGQLTMPEGVQITSLIQGGEDSLPVVQVIVPRAVVEEEAEGEAAEAPAEGEEPPAGDASDDSADD
ncbi:MAG: 50S ribosomal protein L25/general stress protein Ctc [Gammaproteobacteria bacterium]